MTKIFIGFVPDDENSKYDFNLNIFNGVNKTKEVIKLVASDNARVVTINDDELLHFEKIPKLKLVEKSVSELDAEIVQKMLDSDTQKV